MKKPIIILASVLVTALLIFVIFSPSQNTQGQNTQPAKSSQIEAEVKSNKAVLIDVRTASEFNSGHSATAINFDSVLIAQGQLPNIAKDTKIYLYCRSGNRATQVKSTLEAQGYNNVVNLGGLSQMKNLGLL